MNKIIRGLSPVFIIIVPIIIIITMMIVPLESDIQKQVMLRDLVTSIVTGAVTVLSVTWLVIIGVKIFNIVTPEVSFFEELKKGNTAVGIFIGLVILGMFVGFAIAFS